MHKHQKTNFSSTGNIKAAFFLNLAFTVIEIIGGLLTNSVAILTDAVHDLGDTLSLGTSWILEKISEKPRNNEQTFGYKRFSILGALINSLILIIGSVIVLAEAVPRLINPKAVEPKGMLALSVLGITINLAAAIRLRGGQKFNEKVVYLHLLEDVMGWMSVLVISIILLFKEIPILDPILSITISIIVLSKVYPNFKSIVKIFMQYSPPDTNLELIKDELIKQSNVTGVHDIHIWSLDGIYHIFSAHIVVEDNLTLADLDKIKVRIREKLKTMGIDHSTLEFELSGESYSEPDV